MMMRIKRIHWLYLYAAVSLVVFVILFIDVKQKITQLIQMHKTEKNELDAIEKNKKILLNTTLSQQKESQKVDDKLMDTADIAAYVIHLFVSQGMSVNKIQLLKIKTALGINVLPVKVNAVGNFITLTQWIERVTASLQPILINDFALQIDGNGVMSAEIELLVFAMHSRAFTMSYQKPELITIKTLLQSFSLKQMKWAGFLKHEQNLWGLLRLPGGQIVKAQVGSIIGIENGQVVAVTENEMMVDMRQNKIRIGNSSVNLAYHL